MAMSEVAAACAISKPAIYHHYRDKNEIFVQILFRGLDRLHADLTQSLSGGSCREQLERLARLLLANPHCDYRNSERALAESCPPEQQRAVALRFGESFVRPLSAWFAAGITKGEIRSGNPEFKVYAFLNLLSGIAAMRGGMTSLSRSQLVQETLELFLT